MAPDQNRDDGMQGKLVDRIDRRSRLCRHVLWSSSSSASLRRLKRPASGSAPPNEASRSAYEAERRTSLSGEFARDKGECASRRPFWRSQPDHVPDPRGNADQEKYNQKRRIGVERPVENPANPQADNNRRDELAASPQAKRHRRASRARMGLRFLRGGGARSGPPFQFARPPIPPSAQRRGFIVGISRVRTHGTNSSLARNSMARAWFQRAHARKGLSSI